LSESTRLGVYTFSCPSWRCIHSTEKCSKKCCDWGSHGAVDMTGVWAETPVDFQVENTVSGEHTAIIFGAGRMFIASVTGL
jgi:hypothetical protein